MRKKLRVAISYTSIIIMTGVFVILFAQTANAGGNMAVDSSVLIPFTGILAGIAFSFQGFGIAFVAACACAAGVFFAHNAIQKAPAYHYEVKNSFILQKKVDDYSYKDVTTRKIERSK